MSFRLFTVLLLSSAALAKPATDIELTQQLSLESGYRFTGGYDTNRMGFQIGARRGWESLPLEVSANVWAWKNFSASRHGLADSDVALRQLRFTLRPGDVDISVGLQEVRWGETFGFQPTDIVSARNFRDFALLDHGRNRIPVWLAKVAWRSGPVTVTALGNPKGEVPILPDTLGGVPLVQPAQNRGWGVTPEFGAKVSLLLNDANLDFFVYRHLARFPVLTPSPAGLVASYLPVASLGAGFSRGFAEWVLRSDIVFTPKHPTAAAAHDAFNGTAGADWSAGSGWTLGAQAHVDRYPTAVARTTGALSALVRKTLLHEQLELEAQFFQSLSYPDRWLQCAAKYRFLDGFEARLAVEHFSTDAASPLAVFAQARGRVSTQVTYTF